MSFVTDMSGESNATMEEHWFDDDTFSSFNNSELLPNLTSAISSPTSTMSVFDVVIEALRNASRIHGCSIEVQVWDWDLTAVTFVGIRAPTHINQLSTKNLIKIAVFAAASTFAVLGNVAVVALVSKNRSLRNMLNYYLVNLAVADVVIATFCAWTFLVDNVTNSPWVMGPVVCKLSGFVQSEFAFIVNLY